MRSILLVLAIVLAAQFSALAADDAQTGGVSIQPQQSQPQKQSGGSNTIAQPNSCGSTDRCVAPKGGSCECHCEGSKSVCTINYGKNGPPKR